jgi:2-polyprenyl-3-methyl-5-hydroxy-6-metoxy-1,4-benzoquinol methylase
MDRVEHWERVYGAKQATQVSWYAPHLERSIALIRSAADASAEIIDVGGGASTLVDDLLALGYTNVSVLDVSITALAVARERLGARAGMVKWIAGDVTSVHLPREAYDVWHDRAVFHFLTEPADRSAYVDLAAGSLTLGGHAILATFSLEGPTRCSGLDVVRYSAEDLSRELGPAFALKQETHESHRTPSGAEQKLIYCLFERIDHAG